MRRQIGRRPPYSYIIAPHSETKQIKHHIHGQTVEQRSTWQDKNDLLLSRFVEHAQLARTEARASTQDLLLYENDCYVFKRCGTVGPKLEYHQHSRSRRVHQSHQTTHEIHPFHNDNQTEGHRHEFRKSNTRILASYPNTVGICESPSKRQQRNERRDDGTNLGQRPEATIRHLGHGRRTIRFHDEKAEKETHRHTNSKLGWTKYEQKQHLKLWHK
jgi:hypothetical protein